MFTGIVEELGRVSAQQGDRITFAARAVLQDTKVGDSIAVNGVCLTAVEIDSTSWTADVSAETRTRTTLDKLSVGDPVNLERPVRMNDRLGGHLVQGHVDAVGEVIEPAPNLRIGTSRPLLRYVVEKGSITVDGVSLTVVDVFEDGFSAALIPHTVEVTTLGYRRAGDKVNLEVDVMAKYAERLLRFALPEAPPAGS